MSKIKILYNQEIKRSRWKIFFEKSRFSTPFQSPEFFDFINSISGMSAEAFAVEAGNQLQVLCVVTLQKEKGIKSYFSRRAIIYGGPLIAEDEKAFEAIEALLKAISQKVGENVIYLEIRNLNDYSDFKANFENNGWEYQSHLNIQIKLKNKSMDDINGMMKYNRRREIRLSYKQGALVKKVESKEEVSMLYSVLSNLYNERVKLPLPSLDFFYNLFNSPVGLIFLVRHGPNIIGGSFCVYYPKNTINTLYYCGIRDYHKKIFPTHLAIMGAIEFGLSNNLTAIDLMGAGKPGDEYGVRKYKAAFGGDLVEHGRFLKVCNKPLYHFGKFGLKIYQKFKK